MKSTVALALSLAVNLNCIVGLPHHGSFRNGHALVSQHQRVARAVTKPALIPNSDMFFIKRSLSSLGDPEPNPDARLMARSNGDDEKDCDDEEEDDTSSSSPNTTAPTAQTTAAPAISISPTPKVAYVKPIDTTPTYSATASPAAPSASVDASVSVGIGSSSSSSSSSSYTESSSSWSSESYSGKATFFTQGGVAGSCGTVHSDSDFIVAIDSAMYDDGKFCGKSIVVTRTSTGKSITCTGADECPGCPSSGSLDLSTGAFNALGTPDEGVFEISWKLAS